MADAPSPCVGICSLDDRSGYCAGCMRTSDEIAHWLYYTNPQKEAILAKLEQRKSVLRKSKP